MIRYFVNYHTKSYIENKMQFQNEMVQLFFFQKGHSEEKV